MATETELENLVVRLTGEGSQYQQMLEKAEKSTDSAAQKIETQTKRIEGFGNSIKGFASTALSYIGMFGVATTLGGAFEKFEAFEKGAIRLRATIEANGRSADQAVASYSKFASEIAKTTTVSKGTTMSLLQQAEAMGITGASAEKVVKNAIALAKAKGGEAQEYIRVAIAMEQGNTHMLRHVLGLHQITDESELMAKAQEMIGRGMKIAEAETKTVSAQIEKAKASFATLSKDIGAIVADYLTPLVNKLKEGSEWFQSLDASTRKQIVTAIALVAAIGPMVWIYGSITGKITGAIGAITSWVRALEGATAVTKLQSAVSGLASSWFVWTAAIAAGIYILRESLQYVSGYAAETERLNTALKEGERLNNIWSQRFTKGTQAILEEAKGKDTTEGKKGFLEEQLHAAEKEIGGYERGLKRANEELEEVNTWLNRLNTPSLIEGAKKNVAEWEQKLGAAKDRVLEIQGALGKLTDASQMRKFTTDADQLKAALQKQIDTFGVDANEARIYELSLTAVNDAQWAEISALQAMNEQLKAMTEAKKLADDIDNLTRQLEEEVMVFGMTSREANLFKLQLRGATEEQLAAAQAAGEELEAMEEWQKAMQKGKEVTKEMETPFEKLTDRLEELDDLFLKGAIDLETYNRATDKAADDYEAATKEANKLKEAMKFDAALAGSAEALARISAFQDLIKPASDQVGEVKRAVQAGRLTPEDKEAMSSVAEEINDQTPILIDIRGILGAIKDGINSAGGPRNPDLDTNQPADINGNL